MSEQEPKQENEQEPKQETEQGAGESAQDGGAAQPDYGVLLGMIQDVQANQSVILDKLKSLSDAQSILVDSGAVVHEDNAAQSGVQTSFRNDGFIPLDKMDLSI